MEKYEVVVIGGGHAGCEAAAAAARIGANTLLITTKINSIGEMSCNPAIGGIAKGTVVREIDALDGLMAKVIDNSSIHSNILNRSKGAAVWGPRAQADRKLYKNKMQEIILNYKNLNVREASVENFIINQNGSKIIELNNGISICCDKIVLTTGTFLGGVIHIGHTTQPAGRIDEKPSIGLSNTLKNYKFKLDRLRTGTPPRLSKDSINWSILKEQIGDNNPQPFSFMSNQITTKQISCYLTSTNEKTHEIIRKNLPKSAAHSSLKSINAPRYCPSIEEKVKRFSSRTSHQIFLEPEGLNEESVYPNGISTSAPLEVQHEMLQSISGLEDVKILRSGYAIEYYFVNPTELLHTLETKKISGLYFAGQINGTTGYEEAAGQGLIAGTNAALSLNGKKLVLGRETSYIGVMIDDLVTLGTSEPYRLFTSRAEYRLHLRSDNADLRLTELGYGLSLVSSERYSSFKTKKHSLQEIKKQLLDLTITPDKLMKYNIKIAQDGVRKTAFDLLGYANTNFSTISLIWPDISFLKTHKSLCEQIEIDAKYAPYLLRQKDDIELLQKEYSTKIPQELDYFQIGSLSTEVREKLQFLKPSSIGEIKRIPGITPAAITSIIIYMRYHNNQKTPTNYYES